MSKDYVDTQPDHKDIIKRFITSLTRNTESTVADDEPDKAKLKDSTGVKRNEVN